MKQQLLEAILALTLKQQSALQQEDLEAFESLLEQKQEQIDALQALHEKMPEAKEERHEDLLKQIVALDTANNAEFNRQFEEVKVNLQKTRQQIQDLRQRQHVNDVYNNPYDLSDEEGIFYDKR
ncbi:hypothetical protein [Niameybacter massiliensis]|uniref:hypothetical protein n=1 Tax=Niameybacter massiliensis TaxID=1658108 RepID=UPI0006B5BE9C|nr:hypothetical protein [Niameybacter massiliensis]